MWNLLLAAAIAAASARSEAVFGLRDPVEPELSVHHEPGPGESVLYVHGATFPAALSVNYRLKGRSWADDLHSRGFDVWAFDLAGYGRSERTRELYQPKVGRSSVPGNTRDVAHQIERVVAYIRATTGHPRVSIIAHSWGTLPAGLFAGRRPEWVDRLVLFGPVAQRDGKALATGPTSPGVLVSAADQWESFEAGVPTSARPLLSKHDFNTWVKAYLATDPTSGQRKPASVRVPAGPTVDFNAAWNGHFPYDPSTVHTPTLIVHGEWDPIATDADVAWLVAAMKNVPGGVRVDKLAGGSHRMHLEKNRQALFDAVAAFLSEARQ